MQIKTEFNRLQIIYMICLTENITKKTEAGVTVVSLPIRSLNESIDGPSKSVYQQHTDKTTDRKAKPVIILSK